MPYRCIDLISTRTLGFQDHAKGLGDIAAQLVINNCPCIPQESFERGGICMEIDRVIIESRSCIHPERLAYPPKGLPVVFKNTTFGAVVDIGIHSPQTRWRKRPPSYLSPEKLLVTDLIAKGELPRQVTHPIRGLCFIKLCANPGQDLHPVPVVGLGLILRRHLTFPYLLVDRRPSFKIKSKGDTLVELVQTNSSFCVLGPMTLHAMTLEEMLRG